jgi:hypothetical protein
MIHSVNLAFYRRIDWEKFVATADAPEKLHDTWDEWFLAFLKTKSGLEERHLNVVEVTINIEQLLAFCKKNNLKNTSETRSKYVSLQQF